MARRFGTESVCYGLADNIAAGSGVVSLVAPITDTVLAPKSVVLSAHGGGNVEFQLTTNGDVFLHTHIPSNDSHQYTFPDGFELPKGSGIEIEALTNDGSATIYYCKYDESAGITKVASRAASLAKQNELDAAGRKGIRTPNEANLGDKT